MRLGMTDIEPVARFHHFMGGRIHGPLTNAKYPNGKPYWVWTVSNWFDVERIGLMLRPWLGPRRTARLNEILALKPEHFKRPRALNLCEYEPFPSVAGYIRHRRKGERACPICLESNRMYYQQYYADRPGKVEQYRIAAKERESESRSHR